MRTSPDAVYVIIPCITELGMSWSEIKTTPRTELVGLLTAFSNYNVLHAFDGYSDKDVNELAKNNPSIRSDYARYVKMNAEYEGRAGKQKKIKSFSEVISGVDNKYKKH